MSENNINNTNNTEIQERSKALPYFVVTPAIVHFCEDLSDKDVRIYGYISALTHAVGYCYAGNKYIAETFGVSERTIQRAISNLVKHGFLRSEVTKDAQGKVYQRKLYLTIPQPKSEDYKGNDNNKGDKDNPDDKSVVDDNPVDKFVTPSSRQICLYNNINNINKISYGDESPAKHSEAKSSSKKSANESSQSKSKSSKKKSKIPTVKEDSTYTRIINHFNSKDNTNFKANNKEFVENIDNLLLAYTEEEIISVIDYVRENNYNEKYFRPSTIFRPSNFEKSYEFYEKFGKKKKTCDNSSQANPQMYYVIRLDLDKVTSSPVRPVHIEDKYIFTDMQSALQAFEDMKK